ncbi:hypothetical protein SPICUR_05745 [Spiribacter curvatus]|uniref:Mercuric reductase n=1 Tax=Spiribacter curvatus TaxID=1335757 RepID=U5T7F0_9GAMM|nr:NAD(P)/FAD-dependent oxidoreductase [Spiribacter curvatus]AGY92119.1 hypothetical protein SPICUR_05730 [Spiribacter curvatus]AGY92122.1 hypothetical protein SPICUR_05745 [Spiribacter curvatus]
MAREHEYDLIIVGGGVGGLVTASVAGQLGLDVVLVERGPRLGGDCLHHGCIPSKSLIHSAAVAHAARDAGRLGIDARLGETDLGAVMDRVQSVIDEIQVHDDPTRFRDYGVDVRFGEAHFIDARTIRVKGQRLRARRFVIATGSRPRIPDIPGIETIPVLTNETLFAERSLPGHLAVVGGGPIGTEMAQAFSRLGSRVTLLEAGPQILPRDDAGLAASLAEHLRGEGVDLRLSTHVSRAEPIDGGARLTLSGSADDTTALDVNRVLIAAGRRANTDSLNIEAAGLACGDDGRLSVDPRLRTSRHHIYAIGDCAGPYPFTHMAEYQAGIVISNALFRLPQRVDYRAVPWVTYTDPELAHVGMSAADAKAAGIDCQCVDFPLAGVDRAIAQGATTGELKLVIRRGRIIGASLLAPHAGEIIHELALAIAARIPLRRLAGMVHAYPTLAQITKRAAGRHFATQLFSPGTRRLVRWINRILP